MSVIATLVVGANGATSLKGSSSGLSTQADRDRFLQLHRSAGAYIVGRNSASAESYKNSTAPIFIFTRQPIPNISGEVDVSQGFEKAVREISNANPSPIVVESGVSLMMAMINDGVIDQLQLSISPIDGDGDFIDLDQLLEHFKIESDIESDGTRLLECRYKGNT
jgi:dihydrofolate reductase